MITKPIANGMRVGDNIHHQDQLIDLVSFSTINTMVRRPKKPIPPELFDVCDIFPFLISFKFPKFIHFFNIVNS